MTSRVADDVKGAVGSYRQWIPPPGHPRTEGLDTMSPYDYTKMVMKNPEVAKIYKDWTSNLEHPFYGITSDGQKLENIYRIRDERAPTEKMVAAAERIFVVLSPDERKQVQYDIDDETWRKWSNPEIIPFDVGLRLEHLADSQVDLIWALLKASLSDVGYAKVKASVRMNDFLGEICCAKANLNERSYFFAVYGFPCTTEPWGYALFGHHLCLNIFILGKQMAIGPAFIGAEPTFIDSGPEQGLCVCSREAELGLELMQSLEPKQQERAQIFADLHDANMPEGRWNPVDQRHVAGAFQDNRIIPYEGLPATAMTVRQQELLMSIIAVFNELLPSQPLSQRLALVQNHLSQTHFTWIGAYGNNDAYYYRIQSPVVLVEFDFHSGIYLLVPEPSKHHVHTIQRLPNGGDYGRALVQQWRSTKQAKLPNSGRSHFIRPVDKSCNFDSGCSGYTLQVLSQFESAVVLACHIEEGGCGPTLHYHHVDQIHYVISGSMQIRLGDQTHDVSAGSLVFIPAGLPHCTLNPGPGPSFHLDLYVPAPSLSDGKDVFLIDKPEDVPSSRRTTKTGYVRKVEPSQSTEPLPGFTTMILANESLGSEETCIYYAEVAAGKGGPGMHIHEFDQYYFVLEGELTCEIALGKYVARANTLVILPAGVPHRQYNAGSTTEKHLAILAPPPTQGRPWDRGVTLGLTGVEHFGT